jgi:hypothetical protein
MKERILINGFLFVTLLAVPLVAEVTTATSDTVSGTGFDVLMYKPFDFAYVLLAGVLFIALNSYISVRKHLPVWVGVGLGALLLVTWFVVAFLAVGQLHLSLGGKL